VTAPRTIPARPARATSEAAPRPTPAPATRLRAVPDPRVLRTQRWVRACTAIAALVTCFGLFGVVGVHVMLAQGQGDVQRLQSQVDDQEGAQQRLRVQVAQLESPERIVAAARQLGMTTPSTVVLLHEASLADPPATTIPAPRATTTTVAASSTSAGWSTSATVADTTADSDPSDTSTTATTTATTTAATSRP
jgi:cell division protein FtsL